MTNFIDGKWEEAHGDVFTSNNPATNEVVWSGEAATAGDIESAVFSARKAFGFWSSFDIKSRTDTLVRFAQNLDSIKHEFARLISIENGKPLWEALTEVQSMVGKVALSIKAFEERSSEKIKQLPNGASHIRFRPHGVVAVFGPYNFPGHLANGHIVPALLAGNTVIFKPSELTPAVAELYVKTWHESGLPSGVLNLVQGGAETGRLIVEQKNLDGLFFTGSSTTGKLIHKAMSERPQCILALEMGGNNPLVVESYDDIKAAILTVVQSAYISSGQRCTCARRLVVVENASAAGLLTSLVKAISGISVGAYDETPEPYMGPLISERAARHVVQMQEQLMKVGGKVLVESRLMKSDSGFVSPGLIDVTDVKNRQDEEVFGPLLQVIRVRNFDEALDECNASRFGLAAGLISQDRKLYERFQSSIRSGIINWNTPLTGASSEAPFGGVGLSGNHRPSAYFATDYCSYSVASLENDKLALPAVLPQGLKLDGSGL